MDSRSCFIVLMVLVVSSSIYCVGVCVVVKKGRESVVSVLLKVEK